MKLTRTGDHFRQCRPVTAERHVGHLRAACRRQVGRSEVGGAAIAGGAVVDAPGSLLRRRDDVRQRLIGMP